MLRYMYAALHVCWSNIASHDHLCGRILRIATRGGAGHRTTPSDFRPSTRLVNCLCYLRKEVRPVRRTRQNSVGMRMRLIFLRDVAASTLSAAVV